jgi:hypothetical protein
LVYVLGLIYLVLSLCGLYGAIAYKTGPVVAAVAGYWIKAVLMIIGLIAIGSIDGETYELIIDMTALIIIGVICK